MAYTDEELSLKFEEALEKPMAFKVKDVVNMSSMPEGDRVIYMASRALDMSPQEVEDLDIKWIDSITKLSIKASKAIESSMQ